MPSPNPIPRCGLTPGFDPRPWAGVTVGTWGGNNLVVPANAEPFYDVVTWLSGRGAPLTINTATAAVKTGASTFTWALGTDDHITLTSSSDDFTMSAGFEAFGFDPAGHGLVGGSAPYVRRAPNPWVRDPAVDVYGTIDPASSLPFTVPGTTRRTGIQSVPFYLTSPGADPYDTQGTPATKSLAYLLANCGAGRTEVNAYLDLDGHCVIAWSTNYAFDIVQSSFSFWVSMGFDGTETRADLGLTTQGMRANHPFPGVWLPQDPPIRIVYGNAQKTNTVRLRSRRVLARRLGTWLRLRIDAYAHGRAGGVDDLIHLNRRSLPLWTPGARLNFYPEIWDTRQAVTLLEGANVYDRFRTCEEDGRRGRRAYYVASAPEQIEWEDTGGLELRALVSLLLEEA